MTSAGSSLPPLRNRSARPWGRRGGRRGLPALAPSSPRGRAGRTGCRDGRPGAPRPAQPPAGVGPSQDGAQDQTFFPTRRFQHLLATCENCSARVFGEVLISNNLSHCQT